MSEPLIDAAELATRLGMKRDTILDLARKGKLPSVRPSEKIVRFCWEEVCQAIGWKRGETATTT